MKLFQVDSFATELFKGNPAGVCLLDKALSDKTMLAIAAEMNLSETAYVLKEGDGYRLRWFTPTVEVPLCGHATLAAAHILWEQARVPVAEALKFATLSGELTATKRDSGIFLDFPGSPTSPCEEPKGLLAALGVEKPLYLGKTKFDFWLIEVALEATVRSLKPDFSKLAAIDAENIVVTAKGSHVKYDMVSRFFAPRIGINEDPVTGAAHCVLGPYWGQKLGKSELVAYQASARGGEMSVALKGDRCLLGGRAVTVFEARLSPSFNTLA